MARNPKDVAVSYYHLNKLFRTQGYSGDFENFWDLFENGLSTRINSHFHYFNFLIIYLIHARSLESLLVTYQWRLATSTSSERIVHVLRRHGFGNFLFIFPITESRLYYFVQKIFHRIFEQPLVGLLSFWINQLMTMTLIDLLGT